MQKTQQNQKEINAVVSNLCTGEIVDLCKIISEEDKWAYEVTVRFNKIPPLTLGECTVKQKDVTQNEQ